MKGSLHRALLDVDISHNPKLFTIADLGCGSGPHTLMALKKVTETIYGKCRQAGIRCPDFTIYYNDINPSDLNDLFESLPDILEELQETHGPSFGRLSAFGLLATYHQQLFTTKSVDFVHCTQTLNWLSEVPPATSDRRNPVVNKGKIWISRTSSPSVIFAYMDQFRCDFLTFLQARAEEVVPGGNMYLTFRTRRTIDPSLDESCLLWDYLGEALQDLVKEGIIEEEQLDGCNLAYYEPHPDEVRTLIQREGSFNILSLNTLPLPWAGVSQGLERPAIAEIMTNVIREASEQTIENHFGSEVMDPLFERYYKTMEADAREVVHATTTLFLARNINFDF